MFFSVTLFTSRFNTAFPALVNIITFHHLLSYSFSIIFMNLFSAFFVISISFHIKNGSFPLIQIHTGAPLAPLPQIPLFLHSKHAFSLPPPTCEKRSRAAHSDLCVAFCTPLLRKPFLIFPLHFKRILRILRMVYGSLTCVPPRNLH